MQDYSSKTKYLQNQLLMYLEEQEDSMALMPGAVDEHLSTSADDGPDGISIISSISDILA